MRRHRRSPRKMQHQMFKYALIISLLVLMLFSVTVYFYISNILIDREHVNLHNLNSSFQNQIETNLRELDRVTADLNYVNRLTGFLTNANDWAAQSSVRNTILSVIGSVRLAYQVNLYPLSGEMTGIGNMEEVESADNQDTVWLHAVQGLKGKKLLSAPYYTTQGSYSGDHKWLISISRAALDSKNNVIGTLEAVGRCKSIFAPAISYSHQQQEPASLYIFADDGTQIYPYQTTVDERKTAAQIFNLTSVNPNAPEGVNGPAFGETYQYVRTYSKYSGWHYISLQKRSIIFRPVYRLIMLLIGVGAGLALLAVLFAWIFARRMVVPVKQLGDLVQHLRLDTLGQVKADDRSVPYEELDQLFNEFQEMSDSLQSSVQELEVSRQLEFKAQMTALQMQMNPHFYYNTLSCISVLAENGQTDDVASMCRTLSDLMRYITDTNTPEVMLFQEIGIVQKYLYCMKMRYQGSLNITLETDEALNTILVPKLILQPLVENAVKYGTDCIPPWHLRIIGRMEEDRWYFTVEDSGNGFSGEALNGLGEKIEEINRSGSTEQAPQRIGGMGLVNVYLRWKLYCHGSEIFEYGNNADGHAYVTIGRRTK